MTYDSSLLHSFNAGWTTSEQSPIQLLRQSLRIVRARSREQYRNSPTARTAVNNAVTNVIGSKGITLQSQVVDKNGKPDDFARGAIERGYLAWQKQVNYVGGHSCQGLSYEVLAYRSYMIDGEVFERRHTSGRYACQYELIDPVLIDVNHNDHLRNGNIIIMGIEYDQRMRPVAYHINRGQTYNQDYLLIPGTQDRAERIPASQMLHTFDAEFVGQLRGIPPAATSLELMRMLQQTQRYTLAKLKNSQGTFGYYEKTPEEGAPSVFPAESASRSPRELDEQIEMVEGSITEVPEGWSFKSHEPHFPGDALSETTRSFKAEIAASLGQGYHTISGDLTQVNFSSLRAGAIAERDHWRVQQQLWISRRLDPRFDQWLEQQLALGNLTAQSNTGTVSLSRELSYYQPRHWQPRTWDWVQPHQEVSAKAREIEIGVNTPTNIMLEQGRDPDKIRKEQIEQKEHELKLATIERQIREQQNDTTPAS